MRIFYHRRQ